MLTDDEWLSWPTPRRHSSYFDLDVISVRRLMFNGWVDGWIEYTWNTWHDEMPKSKLLSADSCMPVIGCVIKEKSTEKFHAVNKLVDLRPSVTISHFPQCLSVSVSVLRWFSLTSVRSTEISAALKRTSVPYSLVSHIPSHCMPPVFYFIYLFNNHADST